MESIALLATVLLAASTGFLEVAAHPVSTSFSTGGPQVDLGYAIYEGISLSNGVNQFLGMRYAAPPIGDLRFRRPIDPLNETGIVDAKEHGPLCYGVSNPSSPAVPGNYSEDCLFIDLYVPANASASEQGGLPVLLWIQGGGFVQLFNPNYNGTGLIEASMGNVIVATFNYRVGPYGFLANEELASEKNLNNGLHDQRRAIKWVQQHISQFGGNPNNLTIFGTSCGGGSVLLQLLAYGGNSPPEDTAVWGAGIAEAFYLPSVNTVDQAEFHYEDLLEATSCNSLACLRSLPIETLQAANSAVPYPGQIEAALFGYGPVIDGSLVPDRPLNLLKQGMFLKDKPLIIGSSRTEGTIFAPQANSTTDVDDFVKTQLPGLTNTTLQRLNQLYDSTPATLPGVTVKEAPFFYQAAEMFGDGFLTCPTYNVAKVLSEAGVPVHSFIDNIRDPVEVANGFIVPHTWEVQAVWGPSYAKNYGALSGANSYDTGKTNAAIVPVVQSYWTSFARSLSDPNLLKMTSAPTWGTFGTGHYLSLQTNATKMDRWSSELIEKCAFWESISNETYQ